MRMDTDVPPRPRARQLGLSFPGETGTHNAITDVAGVQVGYQTLVSDEAEPAGDGSVARTGVTVVLPLGREGVGRSCPAGWYALNGNGEMTGTSWVEEVGAVSLPIGITNTHAVGAVYRGIIDWAIARAPEALPLWLLPVVGETWDGYLNDINTSYVTADVTRQALKMTTETGSGSALDVLVEELRHGARTWTVLSLRERRDLLAATGEATQRHAQEWVDVACDIKGLPAGSPLAGEEWISGPYALLGAIDALSSSLSRLESGHSPLDGFHTSPAPGDRTAVQVLPHNVFDRLLLNGFSAEVWSRPGVRKEELEQAAGLGQLTPGESGGVGVVLGAGNIFSIAPLDALYELYANNRVVLLKLNPITDPLLPVLEKMFASFIELGLVRIVTGGVEVGSAAVAHTGIDHVHITGSVKSHDAIVFGPGDEGRARQARGEVQLDKPITSELGGVSPTIVVPGRWSRRDLEFQAEHIVTQKLHNNGYNCIASQVLVLSADWAQKDDFLTALHQAYAKATSRTAYYPGSDERSTTAVWEHPGATEVGEGRRILLDDVPATGDAAFTTEYFGPVLAITYLPGDAEEFLGRAVELANERLAGTLGANIVIHPRTIRELGETFTEAVTDLRYGTVAINAWTGVGYLTARATWGAFPGHTLQDAQSGIGIVHNGLLLAHTERTVVRGPFRPFPRSVLTGIMAISPRPPWFVTNRTAAVTGRRLTHFAAKPSWGKLPAIFASALRG